MTAVVPDSGVGDRRPAHGEKILAFGEILLRLSPPRRELLLQSPSLDVWFGGSEANVATQLALLGHDVRLASRVPDNELGHAAIAKLRAAGVDVSGIALGGERIGLYFVTSGAGRRATNVLYDRDGSAFAEADHWDWDSLMEGAYHLHLSGITPALGPRPAEHALRCVDAASRRGLKISFDGNWRGKLWSRWDGDPRSVLSRIMNHVDILFGDRRDIALLLDRQGDFDGVERTRAAADALFHAFPRLALIAATSREVTSTDRNRIGARIDTRETHTVVAGTDLGGIVDRIGSGDAFVAGVLDALRRDCAIDVAATNGLALAILKHSLPGDAGSFRRADIEEYLHGDGDVRR